MGLFFNIIAAMGFIALASGFCSRTDSIVSPLTIYHRYIETWAIPPKDRTPITGAKEVGTIPFLTIRAISVPIY